MTYKLSTEIKNVELWEEIDIETQQRMQLEELTETQQRMHLEELTETQQRMKLE